MPIADLLKYKERARNLAVAPTSRRMSSRAAMRNDVELPLAKGKYRKAAHRIAMLFAYRHCWYGWRRLRFSSITMRPGPIIPFPAPAGFMGGQNNHRHVVYLTQDEKSLVNRLMFLPFCLFFVGFTVDRLFGEPPQPLKSKVPWENRQY